MYYGTDEYHLLLMRAGVWEDITSQTANLSSTDEMNTLSVEVGFSINANPLDKYIPKLAVQVGDKIKIMNKDVEVFQGVVTEDSLDFAYIAHDFGWYLNKSTLTFKRITRLRTVSLPSFAAVLVCRWAMCLQCRRKSQNCMSVKPFPAF